MNNIGILFPLLIVLLFVPILLNGRKQKRQMSEMQLLQRELNDGDVVMTTSGLRGTVVDTSYEETVDIEIAPGVVTTWLRGAVREKINPSSPDEAEGEGRDSAQTTESDTAVTTDSDEVRASGASTSGDGTGPRPGA
ncbi:MAG TPA: preprotein translocase subunit YajC [Pseudonocardia sp.]|jgi:preprotein translocase subunit YajC